MRIQYNITTVGSPTLSNGILSNTSQSNYGIISEDFKPSSSSYEVVINLNCSDVSRNQYFFYLGDSSKSFGGISFNIDTQLYIWGSNSSNQVLDARGITTLSSDTDYWVKFTFDGTNTYKMYLSTDGVNYTQEISTTSNLKITDSNNEPTMVGYDLDGSINLLNTYIKIGDTLWWRGATNVTNIQLRHDTAANWTSVNPVLLEGEVGIETDTTRQKVGDGSTAWNSLDYQTANSVTNQNTGIIKYWTGTQLQYDAILVKDSNTIYNVEDTSSPIVDILNTLYPVGAIYIGTMGTCPLAVLGVGTWTLVAQDRVLQGAGTRGAVGTTISESLPNITGTTEFRWGCIANTGNGAFSNTIQQAVNVATNSGTSYAVLDFDASRSSSTYQNSAPVQPDGYLVNIWERTA